MKRIILEILACMAFSLSHAQSLNVGVLVPTETTEGIPASVFHTLEVKIERMLSSCDAAAVNASNIVLYPEVVFLKDDMIEGGMRNIYSVDFELTLKLVSIDSRTTFGTTTWELKGKGYSKQEAVKEGFSKLSANDGQFAQFFNGVKSKVAKYYESNRASLITQAKTLAKQGNYEEAMAVLYDYPSGINGYTEVQNTIGSIYRQYQTANCSQIVQQAQARFAQQDYEGALALLSDLDATSPCASTAKSLITQIRQKINQDQANARAYAMAEKKLAASVEKARINAVSNIVSAYYKRNRPRVTYNTFVVRRW